MPRPLLESISAVRGFSPWYYNVETHNVSLLQIKVFLREYWQALVPGPTQPWGLAAVMPKLTKLARTGVTVHGGFRHVMCSRQDNRCWNVHTIQMTHQLWCQYWWGLRRTLYPIRVVLLPPVQSGSFCYQYTVKKPGAYNAHVRAAGLASTVQWVLECLYVTSVPTRQELLLQDEAIIIRVANNGCNKISGASVQGSSSTWQSMVLMPCIVSDSSLATSYCSSLAGNKGKTHTVYVGLTLLCLLRQQIRTLCIDTPYMQFVQMSCNRTTQFTFTGQLHKTWSLVRYICSFKPVTLQATNAIRQMKPAVHNIQCCTRSCRCNQAEHVKHSGHQHNVSSTTIIMIVILVCCRIALTVPANTVWRILLKVHYLAKINKMTIKPGIKIFDSAKMLLAMFSWH